MKKILFPVMRKIKRKINCILTKEYFPKKKKKIIAIIFKLFLCAYSQSHEIRNNPNNMKIFSFTRFQHLRRILILFMIQLIYTGKVIYLYGSNKQQALHQIKSRYF